MLKTALSLLALTLLFATTAFAKHHGHCDCSSSSSSSSSLEYLIVFTICDSEESSSDCVEPITNVFDNRRLIIGTFETYKQRHCDFELIDSGVFVTLTKPLSQYHNPCDASSLDVNSTIHLYGVNGVLSALFEGRTLFDKCNKISFTKRLGIYDNWAHTSSPTVFIDCNLNSGQWEIQGRVNLH